MQIHTHTHANGCFDHLSIRYHEERCCDEVARGFRSWWGSIVCVCVCVCVCLKGGCLRVTSLRSGPAQHRFDFPTEITICTCSARTQTRTHARTHSETVFNCGGAFCESPNTSCLFLQRGWNEGENTLCQHEGKVTIMDVSALPLFSGCYSFFSFFIIPLPFVYCVFLPNAGIKCIMETGKKKKKKKANAPLLPWKRCMSNNQQKKIEIPCKSLTFFNKSKVNFTSSSSCGQ